jgi:hypothetical protein
MKALLIETDFDSTPYAAFGISCHGVDLASHADYLTLDYGRSLLEDIDRPHVDDLVVSKPLQDFDIPLPYVPDEIPELTFMFKPDYWETAADGRRRLDTEEGRLLSTVPGWWASAMRADLVDTSAARTTAGKILEDARLWLNHELRELWCSRAATATQIANLVAAERKALTDKQVASSAQHSSRVSAPEFSASIDELRSALDMRPSVGLVLAVIVCVGVAAGIAAYAAATWAAIYLDMLEFLFDFRRFVAAAGGLLVAVIAYLNWVQEPWDRVNTGTEKVRQRTAAARQAARTFRSTVARHVATTLQAEIALSLDVTLEQAETEFRRLSTAVTAGFDERQRVPRPEANFFETLDLAVRPGLLPQQAQLAASFRQHYCPHTLEKQDNRPIRFEAQRVAAVVADFVSHEMMAGISSHLLVDPTHIGVDPQLGVLVANVEPSLRRTYVPAVSAMNQPVGAANPGLVPILARPDKTYGLAVASNFTLDEVFR